MRTLVIAVLVLLLLGGIARKVLPVRPTMEPALAPDQMVDFDVLYRQDCSGCHGANGTGGPAPALGDPTYLALANDATIRRVVTNGVPGTPMSAFAQSAGGMLTDKQIDVLVSGIRSRWAKPNAFQGINLPSYSAQPIGDVSRGANAYALYCSSCHGANGTGGPKASSIAN